MLPAKLKLIVRPTFVTAITFTVIYGSLIFFSAIISFWQFSGNFSKFYFELFPLLLKINFVIINSSFIPIILSFSLMAAFFYLEVKRFNFALMSTKWNFQLMAFTVLFFFIGLIALFSQQSFAKTPAEIKNIIDQSTTLIKNSNFFGVKSGTSLKIEKSTLTFLDIKNTPYLIVEENQTPVRSQFSVIRYNNATEKKPPHYEELSYKIQSEKFEISNVVKTKRSIHSLKDYFTHQQLIGNLLRKYYSEQGMPIYNYSLENASSTDHFLTLRQKIQNMKKYLWSSLPLLLLIIIYFVLYFRFRYSNKLIDLYSFIAPALFIVTFLIILSQNSAIKNQRPNYQFFLLMSLLFLSTLLLVWAKEKVSQNRLITQIFSWPKVKFSIKFKKFYNGLHNTQGFKPRAIRYARLKFLFKGTIYYATVYFSVVSIFFLTFLFGRIFFSLHQHSFHIEASQFQRLLYQTIQMFFNYLPVLILLFLPFLHRKLTQKGFLAGFLPLKTKLSFQITIILFLTTSLLVFFNIQEASSKKLQLTKQRSQHSNYSFRPQKNYFVFDDKILFFHYKTVLAHGGLNLDGVTLIDLQTNDFFRGRYAQFENSSMKLMSSAHLNADNKLSLGNFEIPMPKSSMEFIRNYENLSSQLPIGKHFSLLFEKTDFLRRQQIWSWFLEKYFAYIAAILTILAYAFYSIFTFYIRAK